MLRYEVCFALALLTLGIVYAEDQSQESKDHYPIAWAKVDHRPIIDNDRLFKKYKECMLAEKPIGCPRDVLEVKRLVPEIIETLCAKCLPEHVEKFKEAEGYFCQKRRADYEEVRKVVDPTGELRSKFEAKFGKLNC